MKTKTKQKNSGFYAFITAFYLLMSGPCWAGVDDCLKAALNTANPDDLKKSAAFAYNHSSCLQNLVPPTLVPYVALSGSLDAANQSGALNKVGLGFSNYEQCAEKINPGKAAVKQLAPVLKPVCSSLNMDCKMLEGQAADEVNTQLASEVPLLSLLPCSCAAATSGLGVEKIAKLVKETKQCGATLAQVGEALGDAAEGVYDVAGDGVELGKDAAAEAIKLGESIVNSIGSVGCAISKLLGGCGDSPPPSAYSVGVAICKSHQGLWQLGSASEQPNDFSLSCNGGLRCQAKPGKSTQCMQGISKAQSEKADADKVFTDAALREANPKVCALRGGALKKGYDVRCHDGQCKTATLFVAAEYADKCTKGSNFYPQAAEKWMLNGEKPFVDKFEKLIVESIQRDPNTTPVQLLGTYKCRPFLGREEQSLCEGSGGFQVCKKLVDAGKMQRCLLAGGGEYPLATIGKLTNIINASAITKAPASTDQAPIAITNGSRMRAVQPIAREETPLQVSDVFLGNAAQKGCRPFSERRDQLLCDNQAGYDECVQAVNKNYVSQCRNAMNGEIFPAASRQR